MIIDDKQWQKLYNAIMKWLAASTKQATTDEKWTKQMTFDENENDEEEIQLNMKEDWSDEFQNEWE